MVKKILDGQHEQYKVVQEYHQMMEAKRSSSDCNEDEAKNGN